MIIVRRSNGGISVTMSDWKWYAALFILATASLSTFTYVVFALMTKSH